MKSPTSPKINLTTDEKIMIGCTAVVLVAGVWMYQERRQVQKEQTKLDTMLSNINAASIMSAQAIQAGNQELLLGNQMLRTMIHQNVTGTKPVKTVKVKGKR